MNFIHTAGRNAKYSENGTGAHNVYQIRKDKARKSANASPMTIKPIMIRVTD